MIIHKKLNNLVCFAMVVLLAISFTLTYGIVYAALTDIREDELLSGDEIVYPSVVRDEHIFMGWKDVDTGEMFTDVVMPARDVNLQAQWTYAPLAAAFDNSSVAGDLQKMTANGKKISLADYPLNPNGTLQILAFIEWAYSPLELEADNYAVYMYIYNPTGADIDVNSPSNKVLMASNYDAEGKPIDYDKYSLFICSKSADNRFLKVRIIDREYNGQTIKQRVNPQARRYDVAGIELYTTGAGNPTDYGIGGTFVFTGYAVGMNNNSTSTLACTVTDLETVALDVSSTFWRPDAVGETTYDRNQLDSVYFGVPNSLIELYGSLQKIKAEWYDYRTNGILVVNNQAAYNDLLALRGIQKSDSNYDVEQSTGEVIPVSFWKWSSNLSYGVPYWQDIITTVFYRPDIDTHVTADELEDYLLNYNLSFNAGTLPISGGDISADLFNLRHSVDGPITGNGYTVMEIDAGDEYNLISAGDSAFRQWLLGLLRYDSQSIYGINAIYAVRDADLLGTNEEISNRLYIDVADVPAFKTTYNENKAANKTTYIFRFAQSVYTAYNGLIVEQDGWIEHALTGLLGKEGYVAFETVYLNFDIIQLTFNRDGVYKVLPVVANPINILSDVEPPIEPDPIIDIDDLWEQFRARFMEWLNGLFPKLNWKHYLIIAGAVGAVILVLFARRNHKGGSGNSSNKSNRKRSAATVKSRGKRK